MIEKRCPRCSEVKIEREFYKNKRDGLSPYCKPCSAAYKRKGTMTRAQMHALAYPEFLKKVCSKCGTIKTIDQFGARGRGENLRPSCKVCQYESFKKWEAKRVGRPVLSRDQRKIEIAERVYPTSGTKVCSKCKAEKNLSAFGSHSHRFQCKDCRNEKESSAGPDKQAQRKASRVKWRTNNLELARECARTGTEKRRVISLSIETTLTREEWIAIIEKYGGKCLRCGKQARMTMDHVIPVSKGGPHSAANIQPLCGPCNSAKGRKVIDYRAQGGMTCQ